MADVAAELLTEFKGLEKTVKKTIWRPDDERFLKQIAENIAGLTGKLLGTADEKKKARYHENIDLLKNHVVVLAFSRMNLIEKEVGETILRVLEAAVNEIVGFLMKKLGIS